MRVDESIKSLLIILSGVNPDINIFNPRGMFVNHVSLIKKTVDLKTLKVYDDFHVLHFFYSFYLSIFILDNRNKPTFYRSVESKLSNRFS